MLTTTNQRQEDQHAEHRQCATDSAATQVSLILFGGPLETLTPLPSRVIPMLSTVELTTCVLTMTIHTRRFASSPDISFTHCGHCSSQMVLTAQIRTSPGRGRQFAAEVLMPLQLRFVHTLLPMCLVNCVLTE